jgi:cellobiose phosphorylase
VGSSLIFNPCSKKLGIFQVEYRFGNARYHIIVNNPEKGYTKVEQITLDDEIMIGVKIPSR